MKYPAPLTSIKIIALGTIGIFCFHASTFGQIFLDISNIGQDLQIRFHTPGGLHPSDWEVKYTWGGNGGDDYHSIRNQESGVVGGADSILFGDADLYYDVISLTPNGTTDFLTSSSSTSVLERDGLIPSGISVGADSYLLIYDEYTGGAFDNTVVLAGANFGDFGMTDGLDLAWTITNSTDILYLRIGSAIPEPSTYAALLGIFALTTVAYKRRKRKQSLLR